MSSYRIVRYSSACLPDKYRGLILSRWKRSLRYGNDYFKLVRAADYYLAYEAYLQRILKDPATYVRLAVLDDEPDIALGFSVVTGSVLHYVHVHKFQRRLGIGTALVPHGIESISHVTRTGLSIWGSKYPEWHFNPFV